MTYLILAQKVKEEKKKNSLVLLILLLVSIFLHINSTPSAHPSFRACYEGLSVRGMTFQWRKRMDQWIKETTPSKTWGKTRRDGWEEAITHMPHALEFLWVFFFHSSLFHNCIQLLQPSHRLTWEKLSISVTNGLVLTLQLSPVTQILY